MKKNLIRIFLLIIISLSLVTLSSCGLSRGESDVNSITSVRKIESEDLVDTYVIEFTSGEKFTFTVTNGTDGVNGVDGVDGVDGINGFPGTDGREVVFDVVDGYIVWKYEGESNYNNLIAIEELKGERGPEGPKGEQGIPGESNDNIIIDREEHIKNLYHELVPTVVTLLVYTRNYYNEVSEYSSASGVVYDEDSEYAYIYTNAHAVPYLLDEVDKYWYEVVFYNSKRVMAELVTRDLIEDVAVLRILKNDNYEVAKIGDSDDISKGETVIAIGSPLALVYQGAYSVGKILNYNIPVQTQKNVWGVDRIEKLYLIQSNAPINKGNSGGPLFNLKGELIGINTLKLVSDQEVLQGFNFSLPINHFRYIANYSIINGIDSYIRPSIGVEALDLMYQSIASREENNKMIYDEGLLIINVLENSLNYGVLKVDDTIIEIQGIKFRHIDDFTFELKKYTKGDVIELTVMRNGERVYLEITVDNKNV